MTDLREQMVQLARQAKAAARMMAKAGGRQKNATLRALAEGLRSQVGPVMQANQKDLDAALDAGLDAARVERSGKRGVRRCKNLGQHRSHALRFSSPDEP